MAEESAVDAIRRVVGEVVSEKDSVMKDCRLIERSLDGMVRGIRGGIRDAARSPHPGQAEACLESAKLKASEARGLVAEGMERLDFYANRWL